MRSAFQVIALAAFMVVSASASSLPLLSWLSSRAEGEPADIFGRYNIVEELSTPECPRSVFHRFAVLPNIPHARISMNGNPCNDNGRMEQLGSTEEARETAQGQVATDFINQISEMEERFETLYYFIERDGRDCGAGENNQLPDNTLVVILRTEETLRVGSFRLRPSFRYMNIITPTGEQCIYSAMLRPSPSVSPVPPSTAATPSSAPMVTEPMEPDEEDPPMSPLPPSGQPPVSPASPVPSITVVGGDEEDDEEDDVVPVDTPHDVDGDGDVDTDQDGDGDVDEVDAAIANASPSASADAEEDGVCFPADAQVTVEGGLIVPISALSVGHRVKVSSGEYSDVFMFSHKMAGVRHEFVTITTSHGDVLSATPGHYIYINNKLAASRTAKVGDTVTRGDGSVSEIVNVIREFKTGLYNPQTVHGDIIVNNVRASTFTQTVDMSTAQALLAPLRMFYHVFGFSTSAFDNGADSIVPIMPKGGLVL